MASITMTGCQVNLAPNELGKIVTTPFYGTAGIKISSVKFENDTGSNTYLTTNGAGQRTLYLNIRGINPANGALNQEVQIKAYPIVNTGPGIGTALGTINNPIPSTVFTGNVQLVIAISAAVGADTGFIGNAKVTFTYETRPTVSAGTTITKTQMDNLRAFLGNSPTAVTQNTVATAAVGNTYKSGLTAGTTPMTAAWYNSAGT